MLVKISINKDISNSMYIIIQLGTANIPRSMYVKQSTDQFSPVGFSIEIHAEIYSRLVKIYN
jgi:hypothetical protein